MEITFAKNNLCEKFTVSKILIFDIISIFNLYKMKQKQDVCCIKQ